MRAHPTGFESLFRSEKELSLKDLPYWLIILLVAIIIISFLGFFGVFSFYLILDVVLSALVFLLLLYYFLQKRRLRNKIAKDL